MAGLRYKYRWFVNDVRVYPTYAEGLSKQYSKEDKRVFFREKLTGTLTFLRAEFAPLWNVPLDTLFTLVVQRQVSGVWVEYCRGEFYKTDDAFDVDNRIVTVQIKAVDKYEKILSAINREFDVVRELLPSKYRVKYTKQALVQIAFPGHTNLFNIIGDSTYVIQTSGPIGSELVGSYGFVQGKRMLYIPGTGDMIPDVSGFYEHVGPEGVEIDRWVHVNGLWRIVGFNGSDIHVGEVQWRIVRMSDDEDKYRTAWVAPDASYSLFRSEDFAFEGSHTFFATINGPPNVCRAFDVTPYMRVMTDNVTVQGNLTIPKPVNDIGEFNYSFYIDPSFYDGDEFNYPNHFAVIQPEQTHTTTPTEFGRYSINALHWADQYFSPDLTDIFSRRIYPLLQKSWLEYSLTTNYSFAQYGLIADAGSIQTLNDAYRLSDVIKLMVGQMDPAVGFEGDIAHSQFLFNAVNPLTGDANPYTIFISPKTNILVRDYDRADPTEYLTYGQIEEFFSNAPNVHWFIDSNGQLRWEHIFYYKNGKSYGDPLISEDLTAQIDPRLEKLWSFHTNKFDYKKETLHEFTSMSWPEDVSDIFNGTPMRAVAGFVDKGQTDSRPITKFTTDIDFALAFPNEVAKEGFLLFSASMVDDDWMVPIVDIIIAGQPTYRAQNGVWAMRYLHDKYWKDNCPALDMIINGEEIEADTVKRAKKQGLMLPSVEPDPMLLIRSSIGVGEVEGMDVNFTTRINKLGLLHDLDFDAPG